MSIQIADKRGLSGSKNSSIVYADTAPLMENQEHTARCCTSNGIKLWNVLVMGVGFMLLFTVRFNTSRF